MKTGKAIEKKKKACRCMQGPSQKPKDISSNHLQLTFSLLCDYVLCTHSLHSSAKAPKETKIKAFSKMG